MANRQAAAFALMLIMIGSLAVYSYSSNASLSAQNQALEARIVALEANLTRVSVNLAMAQDSLVAFAEQNGQLQSEQMALAAKENSTAQLLSATRTEVLGNTNDIANMSTQLANAQSALIVDANQLSNLSARLTTIQAWDIKDLQTVSAEIQNITAKMSTLQSALTRSLPQVLLRTTGTSLAAFVNGTGNRTYLRLTETGIGSIVESALGCRGFNASRAGATAQWYAVANSLASDGNHWTWPLVLENSPGGTEAIEFEDGGGVQEAAVVHDGVRVSQLVTWNPNVPHLFKVVVVVPGQEVQFYIDGNLAATITGNIPTVGFLLFGGEVKQTAGAGEGVAQLDVYGGMIH